MTITCAYTVEACGTIPVTTIAAELAAVPLDQGLLQLTGLTLNSDHTGISGSAATRTIVLNETASFLAQCGSDKAASVRGWMTSAIRSALKAPVAEAAPVVT